jgi:phosphonate transport system substrate-binding protein
LAHASPPAPIRFGILPIGSAAESREQWKPLLDDVSRQLARPITVVSVGSYGGLSSAIGSEHVDIAFLSGKLALEAVLHQRMAVMAQFVRLDGAAGNVALLIVRKDSPITDLKALLARPGYWRYARGEDLSVTGFIAPETQVFAPRGLNSDTFFTTVTKSNHQNNMLAVVNRETDVCAGNNPDFDLFSHKFPAEANQLQAIWHSTLIPAGVLVVSDNLADPLRSQLVDVMRRYGRGADAVAAHQRDNLARVPDLAGFRAADNSVLEPFVAMDFALMRQQAEHGMWIDEASRAARLRAIDAQYKETLTQLKQPPRNGKGL